MPTKPNMSELDKINTLVNEYNIVGFHANSFNAGVDVERRRVLLLLARYLAKYPASEYSAELRRVYNAIQSNES